MEISGRHPATNQILRWFDCDYLTGDLYNTALAMQNIAVAAVTALPDGPELTAGLRKLLEAKDCFVRAAITRRDTE